MLTSRCSTSWTPRMGEVGSRMGEVGEGGESIRMGLEVKVAGWENMKSGGMPWSEKIRKSILVKSLEQKSIVWLFSDSVLS